MILKADFIISMVRRLGFSTVDCAGPTMPPVHKASLNLA